MKHLMLSILCLAAFVIVATASAQSFGAVKVHLANATYIGNTQLPAGDYTIHSVSGNNDMPMLMVESDHTRILVDAMIEASPRRLTQTELVIKPSGAHDGEPCVSEIRIGGLSTVFHILPFEK